MSKIEIVHPDGRVDKAFFHKASNTIRYSLSQEPVTIQGLRETESRISTDVPGLCVKVIGIQQGRIIHSPSSHHLEFMQILDTKMSTAEIADRTGVSVGGAGKWSASPWTSQHVPIPKGRLMMLKASMREDPPGVGGGRKRRARQS